MVVKKVSEYTFEIEFDQSEKVVLNKMQAQSGLKDEEIITNIIEETFRQAANNFHYNYM